MTVAPNTRHRTKWGLSRFGSMPAMALAIPVGLLLAVGAGALTLWTGVASGERALLIAGVFAFAMVWGFVGLAWAVVVDRTTVLGAIDRPEESIESIWLDTAMAGAMRDVLIATGLGLAVLNLTKLEMDAGWALTGVLLVAIFGTVVRYFMAKARG